MKDQRRRAERYRFDGVAEIVHVQSGAQVTGSANILSLRGCFVKAETPFLQGSTVRVKITQNDGTFAALGFVVYANSKGMGIAFASIPSSEQTNLKRLLTGAAPYTPHIL